MASLRRQSTTIMIARVVSYIAYLWVILSLTKAEERWHPY